MSNIDEILKEIKKIEVELIELKNSDKINESEYDFVSIEAIAKKALIKNELLNDSSDYIKNMYIKMLCVILLNGNNTSKDQILFIQRIIFGSKINVLLEEYMRQAKNIDIIFIEEFSNEICELDLAYCFIVDVMVLANLSKNSDRQNNLIISIIELLKVSKTKINYLMLIAKSILYQDSDIYFKAEKIRPTDIDYKLFLYHTMNYLVGVICCTESKLHIGANSKQKFDISKIFSGNKQRNFTQSEVSEKNIYNDFITIIYENRDVLLKNLIIDLSKYQLEFSENENIKFENCEFFNGSGPVIFSRCKNIYIENCTFKDFTPNLTMELFGFESMKINKSCFNNCIYDTIEKGDSIKFYSGGGVIFNIYSDDIDIDIEQSEFKNCGLCCQLDDTTERGAIINGEINSVINSKFISCITDFEDSYGTPTLFHSILEKCENNEVVGSTKLNQYYKGTIQR